ALPTDRKSPFGLVELMAADTQIRQDAVYAAGIVQTKEPAQAAEIMRQERNAGVIRNISSGIAVLVKGKQFPIRAQPLQYTPRMTAAAERTVDINAVRPDLQSIQRFL